MGSLLEIVQCTKYFTNVCLQKIYYPEKFSSVHLLYIIIINNRTCMHENLLDCYQ